MRFASSALTVHERDAERHLLEAMGAAEFPFGQDIRKYLGEMWEDFCKLDVANFDAELE